MSSSKMAFSLAASASIAVLASLLCLATSFASFSGSCDGPSVRPMSVCQNAHACIFGSGCFADAYVCADGSCGPNGAECARAVSTDSVPVGSCQDIIFYNTGATCFSCTTFWCSKQTAFTGRDPLTGACLNCKCTYLAGVSPACVPS